MLCEACKRIGSEFDHLFKGFVPAQDFALKRTVPQIEWYGPSTHTEGRYQRVKHHTSYEQVILSAERRGTGRKPTDKRCQLCRLLVQVYNIKDQVALDASSYQLFSYINGNVVYDERHRGAISLKIDSGLSLSTLTGLPNDMEAGILDLCVVPEDEAAITGIIRGRPVTSKSYLQSIPDTVRPWMQECFRTHYGRCCRPEADTFLPTRVIDVGSVTNSLEIPRAPFILQDDGIKGIWVALSHCWGGKIQASTTMGNLESRMEELVLDELPRNFIDAIKVTRLLGFRYLWIDSLCIIQDSPGNLDWARESTRMNQVYQGAAVTLIADAAENSQEGFLERKIDTTSVAIPYRSSERTKPGDENSHMKGTLHVRRHLSTQLHGPLQTRAWTLQEEILSPRALYFTKERLIWICHQGIRLEGDADPNVHLERTPVKMTFGNLISDNLFEDKDSKAFRVMTQWYQLVSIYATRSIAWEKDRFPALAALAQTVNRMVFFQYKAGLWLEDMHRGLLWAANWTMGRRQRQSTAPSWSWASQDFTGWAPEFGPYSLMDCFQVAREGSILAKIEACEVVTLYEDIFGQVASATLQICGPTQAGGSLRSEPQLLVGSDLSDFLLENPSGFHRQGNIGCVLDDLHDWGFVHGGSSGEWMQRSQFKQRVVFLQIAKWSRNQSDMKGTVYAMILEPTLNHQEYRRRGLAIIPQDNGLADEGWEIQTVTVI